MHQTLKVMVVDDSALFRQMLTREINAASDMEVMGTCRNAYEALREIPKRKPDVVTLDIEMPGMTGTELLKKLLPLYKVPVILVSSLDLRLFDALASGAVDFVRKPQAGKAEEREKFCLKLLARVRMAQRAKVRPVEEQKVVARYGGAPRDLLKSQKIVAIGASTGGTEAIVQVVRDLPKETPPIVITQHMPAGFTKMYAERLDKICHMRAKEAENGDRLVRGCIFVAPGGRQMRIVKMGHDYVIKCTHEEKVNGHAPSVDVLFDSVARAAGRAAIGLILTGMGADGAKGLLHMRTKGAYTLGQDENSCVVYGMPMEARKIGGVMRQVPLSEMTKQILENL